MIPQIAGSLDLGNLNLDIVFTSVLQGFTVKSN